MPAGVRVAHHRLGVGHQRHDARGPGRQASRGLAYTISDRVDIEEGAMLNAYFRCVEKHLGMDRTLKDKPSAAKQYAEAA